MKDTKLTLNRRQALKFGAMSVTLAPLATLFASVSARAASDLPHVEESDPTAVGLQYKQDATQANRTDKAGTAADEQFCHNCQFSQGDGDWRPCMLFPNKAVNANGWCSGWTPKA